jgi:hypothetical protein
MAYKPRSAKGSRISIGGTALQKSGWEVTDQADDLDTTTFESGGVYQNTVGIEKADWSLRGLWDAGANAYDNPPGLYPRDNLSTLNFYENVSDNIFWSFPTATVLSSRNGAEVRQLVTFESAGTNNGSFSRPSGSV